MNERHIRAPGRMIRGRGYFWRGGFAGGAPLLPKQRPPHGGDEPRVFPALGRQGRKLRCAGRAKAEARLARAKAPAAESTRHPFTSHREH